MELGYRVWDWLALIFVVALVYMLVRPQSKAAELVGAIGDFVVSLVRSATDLTSGG